MSLHDLTPALPFIGSRSDLQVRDSVKVLPMPDSTVYLSKDCSWWDYGPQTEPVSCPTCQSPCEQSPRTALLADITEVEKVVIGFREYMAWCRVQVPCYPNTADRKTVLARFTAETGLEVIDIEEATQGES